MRRLRCALARRQVRQAIQTGDDQAIIVAYDRLVAIEGGDPVTPGPVAAARIRRIRQTLNLKRST